MLRLAQKGLLNQHGQLGLDQRRSRAGQRRLLSSQWRSLVMYSFPFILLFFLFLLHSTHMYGYCRPVTEYKLLDSCHDTRHGKYQLQPSPAQPSPAQFSSKSSVRPRFVPGQVARD